MLLPQKIAFEGKTKYAYSESVCIKNYHLNMGAREQREREQYAVNGNENTEGNLCVHLLCLQQSS